MPRKRDIGAGVACAVLGVGAGAIAHRKMRNHDTESDNDSENDEWTHQSQGHERRGAQDMTISHQRESHHSHSPEPMQTNYNESHQARYRPLHQSRPSYPRHSTGSSSGSSRASEASWSSVDNDYNRYSGNHPYDQRVMIYDHVVPNAASATASWALATRSQSSIASSNPVEAEPRWIWDQSKGKYYYDSLDGRTRHWQNGSIENLRPPPPPKAPTMEWDEERREWYWRDEDTECWVYAGGRKVPFA